MNLRVFIDNKDIGYLPVSSRKTFQVRPGEHTLQVKLEMNWSKSRPIKILVKEDEILNYNCDIKYKGLALALNFIRLEIFDLAEGSHLTDEELNESRIQIENNMEKFFTKRLAPLLCANVFGAGLVLFVLFIILIFSL
jgi:hypothetical protein